MYAAYQGWGGKSSVCGGFLYFGALGKGIARDVRSDCKPFEGRFKACLP